MATVIVRLVGFDLALTAYSQAKANEYCCRVRENTWTTFAVLSLCQLSLVRPPASPVLHPGIVHLR